MFRLFKKKKPADETIDDANLETSLDSNEINIKDNLDSAEDESKLDSQALQEEAIAEENKAEAAVTESKTEVVEETPEQEPPKKEGLFQRLRSGLAKTSNSLTEGMSALVLGKKKIDEDVLEELETRLLMADVGMEATQRIIKDLTQRSSRNELDDVDALMAALNDEMVKILRPVSKPLDCSFKN